MKFFSKKLKLQNFQNWFFGAFLFFCAFLPFQFALNPSPGIDLAITRVIIPAMFLVLFFVAFKHSKKNLKIDNLTRLILFFLALATISLLFTHNLTWSLRKLLFLFSIFPIYFIARFFLDTKQKQRLSIIFLLSGASLLAFFASLQFLSQFIFGIDPVYNFLAKHISPFFLGNSFSQTVLAYPSWLVNSGGKTYMRAVATFPDPHMLSYYFGILIPWSIALWATSQKHKKTFLFSAILLIFADIFTFTRGGYLALIVGAFVILPLVSRQTIKKIFIAAMFLLVMFLIAPQSPVAGRFTSSFNVNEGSNQGRIYNWRQALPVIANHPLGVGIGMYSLAVDPSANYREPIYAHDLYLDIAAELGVQTLLIFIAILILSFIYFWHASKKDPFFIAGVASVSIFAVHSLVETPLYSVHVLTLFLIILALGANKFHEELV